MLAPVRPVPPVVDVAAAVERTTFWPFCRPDVISTVVSPRSPTVTVVTVVVPSSLTTVTVPLAPVPVTAEAGTNTALSASPTMTWAVAVMPGLSSGGTWSRLTSVV